PGCDVRCNRCAENACQIEGKRSARIANRSREWFSKSRANRTIGQAHQAETNDEEGENASCSAEEEWSHDETVQTDQDCDDDHDRTHAVFIGKQSCNRDGEAEEDHANHLQDEELFTAIAERARTPTERKHGHEIEQYESC